MLGPASQAVAGLSCTASLLKWLPSATSYTIKFQGHSYATAWLDIHKRKPAWRHVSGTAMC